MLTPGGGKLLDFGLAKPTAPPVSVATLTAEATLSPPVTEQGTIVGTFQYMSPEQIEGKELDGRSDIFSLGAVLYEMLTGRHAFEGKSQLSIASAILEKDPAPISSIKPLTPPALDHGIRRSLAKDPDDRWQTARDLALELKWIAERGSQSGMSALMAGPKKRKRERIAWALVAIFIAASVAGFAAYLRLAGSPAPVVVADLSPPQGTQFDFLTGGPPKLSPNGRALVFPARGATGKTMLWVRLLDGSPAQPLPGTEESGAPFWSPDSRRIGFLSHRKLQAIEASGGPAVILSDGLATGGGTWNQEGTILFFQGNQEISQVASSGGAVVPVIRMDTTKSSFFFGLRFLPDGKHFLYTLDGKENRLVLPGGWPRGLRLRFPALRPAQGSTKKLRMGLAARNFCCPRIALTGKCGRRTGPAMDDLYCSHAEIWPVTPRARSGCCL